MGRQENGSARSVNHACNAFGTDCSDCADFTAAWSHCIGRVKWTQIERLFRMRARVVIMVDVKLQSRPDIS
jgi:hypothetical protein